jgi:subtilisin family serine protease
MSKAACCAAAVLALSQAPAAAAHRVVSVGYRDPAALRGLRVVDRIPALRVAEVRVRDARALRRLRGRPGIRFVQPPVRRERAGGPALAASYGLPFWQWTSIHEDLVPQWVQAAAARVTIAIVDTGADLTVPSLAGRPVVTWNVVTGTPTVSDAVGHGTFVASLAVGSDVGFGGEARLMVVQANRGGTGFSDVDEARGIVWAADHGANVVNLSVGGSQTSDVERAAVKYAISKGVLLVAAAGNSAQSGNPTTYPAALIGRNGLVVGAADETGARALFSGTGRYVDVLAPGVQVFGALAPDAEHVLFTAASTPGAAGLFGYGNGTSFATPEVAGVAALVLGANPSLTAAGAAYLLEATASRHGRWSAQQAFGEIDAAAAVQAALGAATPALIEPAPASKKKAATTRPAGCRPRAPADARRCARTPCRSGTRLRSSTCLLRTAQR